MSGLSEERRAALTERLEWCRQNASSAPHYSIRDMRDTLEELFAESAALRTERDDWRALAEHPPERPDWQALINAERLLRESAEARLAVPASPDDLARVASVLRERLEVADDDGTPIYLHAEDCPSYCDYACNGNQHSGPRSPVLDELAFLLARLTPPTGPA